ncbi:4'-phosphopantetheinyl transferase family protein [Streptomyces durocortorensis]|uniref:4-phosphopantetheinyl transferase family protein n=1 Tax=Streptomyces durocortorensis TaxID=2811104 RepID=A0ABS2HUJ6_9ACTN|nr:4'-phosphopantetheinyl transferase superfamily protein [Streptomyces durocortorensis]MBM7054400.1 4-phosphopantetheinyl transferase family protein [Streptomyces durocortorensis]
MAPFPVGVDAEAVRDLPVATLADDVLTGPEQESVRAASEGTGRARAFLRCWTRKEAVLKAVGIGIVTDLTALETRAWAPGPAEVAVTAPAPRTLWHVADIVVPDGWTAALAVPASAHRGFTACQVAPGR